MKIYLASSWKNQQRVLELAGILESCGFEVDAFCRATDNRYAFPWSELVDSEIQLQEYDALSFLSDPQVQRAFREDKKWLDWADCVVLVMPCGRSSHLEAGYAKGQGKLLYIWGEFPKGEFDVMYGFADGIFREVEELLSALKLADGGCHSEEVVSSDKLGEWAGWFTPSKEAEEGDKDGKDKA